MAEGRLVVGPRAKAAARGWRSLVDSCALEAGPFDATLLSSWRAEISAVQSLVETRERAAPAAPEPADPLRPGVHALLALAGCGGGGASRMGPLVDVAAAIEFAHRATLHHGTLIDDTGIVDDAGLVADTGLVEDVAAGVVRAAAAAGAANRAHVLRGDWSITQAARLTAEVGPTVYRLLVQGWGGAQAARIRSDRVAAGDELFETAVSLGEFVATRFSGSRALGRVAHRCDDAVPRRVARWAASCGASGG